MVINQIKACCTDSGRRATRGRCELVVHFGLSAARYRFQDYTLNLAGERAVLGMTLFRGTELIRACPAPDTLVSAKQRLVKRSHLSPIRFRAIVLETMSCSSRSKVNQELAPTSLHSSVSSPYRRSGGTWHTATPYHPRKPALQGDAKTVL